MNDIHPALANLLRVLEQEDCEGDAYEGKNFFESDVVRLAMEWARKNAFDEAAGAVLHCFKGPSADDAARLITDRKRIPSLLGARTGSTSQ